MSVVETVKEAVGEIVEEVKAVAEKLYHEIEGEEKVIVVKMENELLKAHLEIQRLQGVVSNIQKNYPEYIKVLAKKYAVDTTKFTFDTIELLFKKIQ